jgi:catechol 2,3-dioxygenase-like lactoylglutathione lyase family enzyme
MQPLRLDHVVIHVSDWERADAFYRDVMGARLIGCDGGIHHYRFGDQQLNVHGPGTSPSRVAANPGGPGSAADGSLLELISYPVA